MLQNIIDQFTPLVKRAISSHINDIINERLKGALTVSDSKIESAQPKQTDTPAEETQAENQPESKVVTTEEELDAYRIVKAICRKKVDISRIVYRDAQTYFSVLLDDNNRKPICRMYFNSLTKKYIATFDENKKETKHEISTLNDIYNFSKELADIIEFYDKK